MEFEDNYYSHELAAVRRMISSSAFRTQGNNAGSGYYREKVQQEIDHNGRVENKVGGEERHDKSQTLHAIFMLQRNKNAALKVFVTINKAFDDKIIGEGFNNSSEAVAARNSVDDAFDNLCASHGELATVT